MNLKKFIAIWNNSRPIHSILNSQYYRISSNKHQASNERRPLISAASLGIHIEISASPVISGTPLNAALIRIVTMFYQ